MKLFDRNAKLAFIAAAITLAGLRVGFRFAVESANAYLEKQPVELRAQLTTIPLHLGNWRAEGEGAPFTAEIIEELGGGTMIKTKVDALPAALSLSQIQARERDRGLQVTEPSEAGGQPADTQGRICCR